MTKNQKFIFQAYTATQSVFKSLSFKLTRLHNRIQKFISFKLTRLHNRYSKDYLLNLHGYTIRMFSAHVLSLSVQTIFQVDATAKRRQLTERSGSESKQKKGQRDNHFQEF